MIILTLSNDAHDFTQSTRIANDYPEERVNPRQNIQICSLYGVCKNV